MAKTGARSNPISQRVMKPLDTDVFTAAQARVRELFIAYDKVVVSYSGGKDSTCVLELAIAAAREMDRLPVEVMFFDEEVLLPETVDMVMRVRERPEVRLTWVTGQVDYWDASSNEAPHWTTWDPAKRDVWVTDPPPFAVDMGRMSYPAPGDAIARLWGPEHGRVAEMLGLRGYESRPRMYGVLSSGSYIARGPAPHVDKARPVYDWRDKDVWLAIDRNGWELNAAYARMYRLRPIAKELRIAVPTSIEAMTHWADWQTLHPKWWGRVRRRFPNIHSLAMFNYDLHRPVRKTGETWQDAASRYVLANRVEDHGKIHKDIGKVLRSHARHSTLPMYQDTPCELCRFSWRKLARIAMFGNPGNRLHIK